MIVNKEALYRKMMFCPRINLECDGVKIRMVYVSNETGNGWMLENFNGDGEVVWHKNKSILEVRDMIVKKYKVINIKWSKGGI